MKYCNDPFNRTRLKTQEVNVGKLGIGGENPIRIQSMTTKDTMDTEGSIEEAIRMIDVGCELVRLTAPSKKEAYNLAEIKKGLKEKGYEDRKSTRLNSSHVRISYAVFCLKKKKNKKKK